MSEILDKARRAMVSYISAGNVGTPNIYDAKSSGDKDVSNVEIDAVNAREEPMGIGNFFLDYEVVVTSIAAVDADEQDPKPGSDALTSNVMALLEIDNDSLRVALSTQFAGFTVMGFGELKEIEQGVEGDAWKTKWRRQIYCAGF